MKADRKILLVYNSSVVPLDKLKLYHSMVLLAPDTQVLFTEDDSGKNRRLINRIANRLGFPIDYTRVNQRLLAHVAQQKPDIVFIVKGTMIWPETLQAIRATGARLIAWSNDDMFARHSRSWYYDRGLKYYDLVVTQKSYNCRPEELPSLGARHILFQNKAYDPALHFPCTTPDEALKHDVLFIGTKEQDRFAYLTYLAENGIKVHIYGWAAQEPSAHPNLIFHPRHLYGADFRCAITHSAICLNFLRKANRDLQTSRSIEIPACGGFMLAERTDEHLALFEEGKEAAFFSSQEELLHKVRYYLDHHTERQSVAQAGLLKCRTAGYSFDERIAEIFQHLSKIQP